MSMAGERSCVHSSVQGTSKTRVKFENAKRARRMRDAHSFIGGPTLGRSSMPNLPITEFSGRNRFLSNFYPAEITLDDVTYRTLEHAYQAAKTLRRDEREKIRACKTPGQAKRAGQRVTMRENWERIKVGIMERLLIQKFSHPDLRAALLATGNAELIEGNDWGDTFWGVCDGEGQNWLGRLIMKVRASIRENT